MLNLFLQLFRKPLIIRIQKGNPVAAGSPDSPIASSTRTRLGLKKVLHFGFILSDFFRGPIGGAVIHDKNFIRCIRLGQHAFDSPFYIGLRIICRNHHANGDKRPLVGHPACSSMPEDASRSGWFFLTV